MLASIARAERFVHAEYYIWRGDQTGWGFADALMERARAGVEVRVAYDALGSIDVDPLIFDEMMQEGIEVLQYKPLAPWRPKGGLLKRNHRKILVVDNRVGFVGGFNLSDDHLPISEGGKGWRDTGVALRGPVVADLNRLFLKTWRREKDANIPRLGAPPVAAVSEESVLVGVLANRERRLVQRRGAEKGAGRRPIRRSYLRAIRSAQRTICITNAYFLPDLTIRRALIKAAQRGVMVRIIVPMKNDLKLVGLAMHNLYRRLIRRGVQVFEWRGPMVHAKVATIDGVWSTVGSYNLDYRSWRSNLEVNVVMLDRGVGQSMDKQFERDLENCVEVTPERIRMRPLWARLLSWFLYRFRRLM